MTSAQAEPETRVVAGRSATFLDFDGTLADTNLVHIYAFYARHAGRRQEVVGRVGRLLADIPIFYALDAFSRIRFAKRLFSRYEGLSQDRLARLADALDRDVIAPRVHPHTADFLAACKKKGPIVLVTGAADFSVAPFARRHDFDAVIATRLEFRHGVATGRMHEPVVFGANKGRLMRIYARDHGLDLSASAAYTDSAGDLGMFDGVGRAGVINPDARLAQMARDYHWQILNF